MYDMRREDGVEHVGILGPWQARLLLLIHEDEDGADAMPQGVGIDAGAETLPCWV